MTWNKEDLSNYNTSKSPWYSVQDNGEVDIGNEMGTGDKISLQPWGMYKLVKEWLNSGNQLSLEERKDLIDILNKKIKTTSILDDEEKMKEISGLFLEYVKNNPVDPLKNIREFTSQNQKEMQRIIDSINKK
ncbi:MULTISPECIES: hypothetical protein [Metabacillus]|nr:MULTISPECIES: hypothetical protein [Metabacillus]QNF26118.1 hypothetical protein HUW50_00260 [Metabacillus sp. KUDC1714]